MKYRLHYFCCIAFLILFSSSGCTLIKASLRQGPTEPVAKIEDISIPAVKGNILVRVYTPQGNGPFPILVYIHGGGWIGGSIKSQDKICRYLSNKVTCIVVSVKYRLAPKHKFPIPVEDCYAATMWVSKNAQSINGDPARIALGGPSAGGNLSAAVCLMAKDRGGPPIIFQLLVIPSTNLSSLDTESYRLYATGHELTKKDVEICRALYLRNIDDRFNPYASPLLAKNHRNLPPALVITGEYDVARDDGKAYAECLKQAGVRARYYCFKGMGHFGVYWTSASDAVQSALDEAVSALREAFSKNHRWHIWPLITRNFTVIILPQSAEAAEKQIANL
jgi:acetyl esterase